MASTSPEAETVHTLLRHITRAFYNTRQIIAYDIILKHSTLRDIHLAQLMNMTPKEVHKFLAPLISDSILQQHSKAEPKTPQEIERGKLGVQEGQERKPRQRVFYFVDYRTAVDAVKWRMVQLTTLLSKDSQTHESQYVCPRCGRRYSTFDAASLLSPDLMSFQCLDCGSTLQEETNSGVDENGEEKAKYARLMQQVDPIVRAMKAVDDIHVPENTFNIALANAIPPFDDVDTSVDYPNLAPTHAVGANDVQTTTSAGQTFKIDFSEIQEGPSAEDIAKRTAQQQQNALPVWHTQSTVSGELTHAGSRQTEIQPDHVLSFSRVVEDELKNKEKIKADAKDIGMEDQIAAYYAAARANAQEDAAQFAAEDADFSEDDGNWEGSNIGTGTAVSSAISTPAPGQTPGQSEEAANGGQVPKTDDDDDDDDEDEEFEDV
jgi:transcription initiation factor TFIIE subunit alpha